MVKFVWPLKWKKMGDVRNLHPHWWSQGPPVAEEELVDGEEKSETTLDFTQPGGAGFLTLQHLKMGVGWIGWGMYRCQFPRIEPGTKG